MAGMNLGGGFAAGAAADALKELLATRFAEQLQRDTLEQRRQALVAETEDRKRNTDLRASGQDFNQQVQGSTLARELAGETDTPMTAGGFAGVPSVALLGRTARANADRESKRADLQMQDEFAPPVAVAPDSTLTTRDAVRRAAAGGGGQPGEVPGIKGITSYTKDDQMVDAQGRQVKYDKSGHPFTLDDKPLSPDQVFKRAPQPSPDAAATRADNRLDKSYYYESGKLDTMRKPISDAAQRMGRLEATIAAGTPQADALVAPELLTVMAGGQGSGLRMNEAEIQRIVGGRSNWEGLKAAVNKWQADPALANSITPVQRQQIRDLVKAVHQQVSESLSIVDDANDQLRGATSVDEHRQIRAAAQKKLSGTVLGDGSQSSSSEPDYIMQNGVPVRNPKKKGGG